LNIVSGYCGDIQRLAVENLENYPVDFNDVVIRQSGCSRCIDIGHLWLDGHDPVPYLMDRLDETIIMHLHGIGKRDHQSLNLMPDEKIDNLFRYLLEHNYTGVLTLEIFSESDLAGSLRAVEASLNRLRG
jgi:sugar phosphate isomerase/epimerase